MGSDTEKKVSWVCFILIKETETQKTSLPVPPMNTDRLLWILPQLDLQTWQACWMQGCTLGISQSAQASH